MPPTRIFKRASSPHNASRAWRVAPPETKRSSRSSPRCSSSRRADAEITSPRAYAAKALAATKGIGRSASRPECAGLGPVHGRGISPEARGQIQAVERRRVPHGAGDAVRPPLLQPNRATPARAKSALSSGDISVRARTRSSREGKSPEPADQTGVRELGDPARPEDRAVGLSRAEPLDERALVRPRVRAQPEREAVRAQACAPRVELARPVRAARRDAQSRARALRRGRARGGGCAAVVGAAGPRAG